MTCRIPFHALMLFALLLHPSLSQAETPDPLTEWNLHESTGAAPGYVDDSACAECHASHAESYAEMGMAKSFYPASGAPVIETFTDLPFFHEPTGRYYDVAHEGGDYIFSRYRLAPDGTRVDSFTRKADWVLGSGHHVRTFLYQTADGALFEIPLAWYSQGGYWEMNPGFEFENQQGMLRQVPRRCMVCHNALPEVPEGSDRAGMPNVFPHDLPHGLGCQRCHGPGADHTRRAIAGDDLVEIRAAIANPAALPPEQLYSICYGCHMQPTVAVNAPLRGGRNVYSFRPGEMIEDYLTHIEITDNRRPAAQSFEINHHPYRMEQSACFTESNGALGCLSCHDPHVKIKPAERAAHYRKACLSCHDTDASGLPEMASAARHPAIRDTDDCTTCHMPERRTQDVIHVTMTDHRITRDPGDLSTLTSPIPKIPTQVDALRLMRPGTLSGDEAVIQQLLAIFSHTARRADYAADKLDEVLFRTDWPHPGPWLELAKSHVVLGRFERALAAADKGLLLDPRNPDMLGTRALALHRLGRTDDALLTLDRALLITPNYAKLLYNKALILSRKGQYDKAAELLRYLLTQRDNHWPAKAMLGRLSEQEGDAAAAIESYLAALATEPGAHGVRDNLIRLLKDQNDAAAADRHALPDSP